MSLNALIARGGTQQASPMAKYMQARKLRNTENVNALNMASTAQTMDRAAQQDKRAADLQQLKMLAPIAKGILSAPDPAAAYQQAIPQLPQYGVDVSKLPQEYSPEIEPVLKSIMEAGGESFAGDPVNVVYKGKVISAVDDGSGNYLDQKTRQPLYGAIKAPSRQMVGTPGQFGVDLEKPGARDKARDDAVKARENVYQLEGAVDNITTLMAQADNWQGGASGTLVQWINSGAQQFNQFREKPDDDLIKSDGKANRAYVDVDKMSKETQGWLRNAAFETGTVNAAVLELAFTHAKYLNNSGKISDADIKAAREIIEEPDKAIAIRKLNDLKGRARRNYEGSRKARKGLKAYEYWSPLEGAAGSGAAPATGTPQGNAYIDNLLKDEGIE